MWFGDEKTTREKVLRALVKDWERRKQKNPSYSIRAYAAFLEIDQSALTRILNGKRQLSWPIAKIVIEKLENVLD